MKPEWSCTLLQEKTQRPPLPEKGPSRNLPLLASRELPLPTFCPEGPRSPGGGGKSGRGRRAQEPPLFLFFSQPSGSHSALPESASSLARRPKGRLCQAFGGGPHHVFQTFFTGAQRAIALLYDLIEGAHVVHVFLQLGHLALVVLQLRRNKSKPQLTTPTRMRPKVFTFRFHKFKQFAPLLLQGLDIHPSPQFHSTTCGEFPYLTSQWHTGPAAEILAEKNQEKHKTKSAQEKV